MDRKDKLLALIIVIIIIFVLSVKASEGQAGYVVLPAGFNYFICWEGSQPLFEQTPAGTYMATCPTEVTPTVPWEDHETPTPPSNPTPTPIPEVHINYMPIVKVTQ
jgi:hypothetical protein